MCCTSIEATKPCVDHKGSKWCDMHDCARDAWMIAKHMFRQEERFLCAYHAKAVLKNALADADKEVTNSDHEWVFGFLVLKA